MYQTVLNVLNSIFSENLKLHSVLLIYGIATAKGAGGRFIFKGHVHGLTGVWQRLPLMAGGKKGIYKAELEVNCPTVVAPKLHHSALGMFMVGPPTNFSGCCHLGCCHRGSC